MEVRTESEIKAYVEGWNDCHKQFCECLKGRKSVIDAVRKMEFYKLLSTVWLKGKNDDQKSDDGI